MFDDAASVSPSPLLPVSPSLIIRNPKSAAPHSLRDGVEEERVGCERLTAVLRAEAEEVDVSLAECDINERGLAANPLRAEEPARQERRARFGVARDDAHAARGLLLVLDFKDGRVLDPSDGLARHPLRNRLRRVEYGS